MFILSFARVIKFAFQDMARNLSLSLMTVLILVLMLLSVNTLLMIRVLTTEATGMIRGQIDVSIYFDHTATQDQIVEVESVVKSFPEVVEMTLMKPEEVLVAFRNEHTDNTDVLASLDELGENPFGATMIIQTRMPEDYEKIITALDVPEYQDIVEAKTFADTQKAIDRVTVITRQIEQFSLALTAFFAFIAFLIIFNTIRVAIYTQRIEISIKRLVGATNWFIRGPYLVESVVFSLLSVLIAQGIVWVGAEFLDPYVMVLLNDSGFLTDYLISHILLLAGIQFLAVLALTMFSSILAMRKNLRA